ncbi:MAG: GNAT family N-acetyltransferase, partial [Verrucomicrobiota bacterium]
MIIPIEITQLPVEDLPKIYTIDRSEEVVAMYRQNGTELEKFTREVTFPDDHNFWDHHFNYWKESINWGAEFFGAMHGDKLAGFTIVRHDLEHLTSQLMALYVSLEYRLSGIAKSLCIDAEQSAANHGNEKMYVSATPSHSSVRFYLSQNYKPTAEPNCDLLDREP